jgi:hypothetical protein
LVEIMYFEQTPSFAVVVSPIMHSHVWFVLS